MNGQTYTMRDIKQANGAAGGARGQSGELWGGPFPSLHLWPLQNTFEMKMIYLPEGQKVRVGRQTNQKTVPAERNAYFDSKVLSRTHAEIWEQGGKIFIRDIKSSNGTFVNGERLSPEGMESDPYLLKSEDHIEFGIDIANDDNRSIMHHKVSAKAYCVFGPDDAALSYREYANYDNQDRRDGRANGQPQLPRIANHGPAVMSTGGKPTGLRFTDVLVKLQAELARSKDAGAELQSVTTSMTEAQDALAGGVPPSQNGRANDFIPPQFRSASAEAQAALAGPHGQQAAAFISLQNQLSETQSSLSGHVDRIQSLETQLKQQDNINQEIMKLRHQIEASEMQMELFTDGSRGRRIGRGYEDDDDDDARSVSTIMNDEESDTRVRERRRTNREDGPRGMRDADRSLSPEANGHGESKGSPSSREREVLEHNSELANRVETLSAEIASAVQASRTLQSQHSEAMSAVKSLTDRIHVLENGMTSKVAEEVSKAEKRWEALRSTLEDGWKKERETWEAERERLRGVVRDWEEASRRANEEEEDWQLNESFSEDEEVDEEDDDDGDDAAAGDLAEDGDDWKSGKGIDISGQAGPSSLSPSRAVKPKRRRPSQRTTLAINALKRVAGAAEDKTSAGEDTPPSDSTTEVPTARLRAGSKPSKLGVRRRDKGDGISRTGSNVTFKGDKESSESGRESVDTLRDAKESKEAARTRSQRKRKDQGVQPLPIFTVAVVALVAGVLYYKHKE